MVKFADAKVGAKVMVDPKVRSVSGHNYSIGAVYTITTRGSKSGTDGQNTCVRMIDETTGWTGNNICISEITLADASRAAKADRLEKEADELEKRAKNLRKEVAHLRKYKDENDELAHLIAEVFTTGADPAVIYKVLNKFGVKASIRE
jgi:23S rRNA G2069 N7-methylase RlmK/C1962 C5-methylase RlmI